MSRARRWWPRAACRASCDIECVASNGNKSSYEWSCNWAGRMRTCKQTWPLGHRLSDKSCVGQLMVLRCQAIGRLRKASSVYTCMAAGKDGRGPPTGGEAQRLRAGRVAVRVGLRVPSAGCSCAQRAATADRMSTIPGFGWSTTHARRCPLAGDRLCGMFRKVLGHIEQRSVCLQTGTHKRARTLGILHRQPGHRHAVRFQPLCCAPAPHVSAPPLSPRQNTSSMSAANCEAGSS